MGRLRESVATSFAISPVFTLAWTSSLGSEHCAVISACTLQLPLHFASALGPLTSASQRGALQVPSHFAWHVVSHWPWHAPSQCPTHLPCTSLVAQAPAHSPWQVPSQLPLHVPSQVPLSRPGSQ